MLCITLLAMMTTSCAHRRGTGVALTAEQVDAPNCAQDIAYVFGDQPVAVVALSAPDRGLIIRPEILAAIAEVTQELELEALAGGRQVRSITNVPIGIPKPGGRVAFTTFGEELDAPLTRIHILRDNLRSIEFSRNDVIDIPGLTAYIHLPLEAFPDGIHDILNTLGAAMAGRLIMAADPGPEQDRKTFLEIAGSGPGSPHIDIIVSAPAELDFKDPQALRALEALQARIEAVPEVAQTFSVVDDVKMVRRNTHDGSAGWGVIPDRRAEIGQLLTLFELSGNAENFGRRMTPDAKQAILRINLTPIDDAIRLELAQRFAEWAKNHNFSEIGACTSSWKLAPEPGFEQPLDDIVAPTEGANK